MSKLDPLFRSMFLPELDADDSSLTTSIYSDSSSNKVADSVADPVGALFKRAQDNQVAKAAGLDWDQELSGAPISKTAHADGVEVKKIGKQTWHYQYKSGAVIGSTVHDPELPGGVMHFDKDGNEIAA